jgi:hypothetical protein
MQARISAIHGDEPAAVKGSGGAGQVRPAGRLGDRRRALGTTNGTLGRETFPTRSMATNWCSRGDPSAGS